MGWRDKGAGQHIATHKQLPFNELKWYLIKEFNGPQ